MLLAIIVLAAICGAGAWRLARLLSTSGLRSAEVAPFADPVAERGRRLAGQYCSRCHLVPAPAVLPCESWPFVMAQEAVRRARPVRPGISRRRRSPRWWTR